MDLPGRLGPGGSLAGVLHVLVLVEVNLSATAQPLVLRLLLLLEELLVLVPEGLTLLGLVALRFGLPRAMRASPLPGAGALPRAVTVGRHVAGTFLDSGALWLLK